MPVDRDEIAVGVIGCGYWGPNHIRNFQSLAHQGVAMVAAADSDPDRRAKVSQTYPTVEVHDSAEALIGDPRLDALVIATPAPTHHPLATAALEAGKHVLVEKPFTTSIQHAEELIDIAEQRNLVLMVGHTFEYTAAVNRIRDLVRDGELGEILYVRSLRLNLGLYQKDINVIWDLAPHDVSILLYVLGEMPVAATAIGQAHVTQGIADIVSLTLEFGPRKMANIFLSWLDPRKVRETTIIGDRKMLVYDDVSSTEKIRIFDKGVEGPRDYDSFGEFPYSYRYGDIVSPRLDDYEPLRDECAQFIECVRTGNTPRSDGYSGLATVKVLAAANASLLEGGRRVLLGDPRLAGVNGAHSSAVAR